VAIIRELLVLVEKLEGKPKKAAIAADIMYVVGQFPSFLRIHWKFSKTVIKKLIEFMHDKYPGVQNMAVETIIKISKKCADCFSKLLDGDAIPFLETLIISFKHDT